MLSKDEIQQLTQEDLQEIIGTHEQSDDRPRCYRARLLLGLCEIYGIPSIQKPQNVRIGLEMIYSIYVLGEEYSHLALKLLESLNDPNNLDNATLNKGFQNCSCPPGQPSVGCLGFMGFQQEMGIGVAIDLKKALALYQLALKKRKAPEQIFAVSHCYKKMGDSPEHRKLLFQYFSAAAAKGNPNAQLHLGDLYFFAKAADGQNLEKALEWYKKAAKQGNAQAQYKIAQLYEQPGSFHNLKKAIKWYARALLQEYEQALPELVRLAESNNQDALMLLGRCYIEGTSVVQNIQTAIAYFQRAADLGDTAAMMFLGDIHYQGIGIDKNIPLAITWYIKAAEAGLVMAQHNIGNFYCIGRPGLPVDTTKGLYWLEKAAEAGFSASQVYLADFLYEAKDFLKALHWYQRAVNEHNMEAAHHGLGNCYYHGGDGIEQNRARGLECWKQAAAGGYHESSHNIAVHFYTGANGEIEPDYAEAIVWLKNPVQAGFPPSQALLADCYYHGHGITRSRVTAIDLYEKAARGGYVRAAMALAKIEGRNDLCFRLHDTHTHHPVEADDQDELEQKDRESPGPG